MKRAWLMTAALLAACSNGAGSGVPPESSAKAIPQVTRFASSASCSFTQLADPGNNLQAPVGASTTDAWAVESQTTDAATREDHG